MSNLGTSRLMQDGSCSSKSLKVLSRIAEVLEMPVADFYRLDAQASDAKAPSAAECELMLTAFLRVRDPDLRNRVIDMMRAYTDH